MGHEYAHRNTVNDGCEGQALAVIAACGRYQSFDLRPLAHQPIEIGQPAANLERTRRVMILVLDEKLCAYAPRQKRPVDLSRWR
jgi:hypothetical protein